MKICTRTHLFIQILPSVRSDPVEHQNDAHREEFAEEVVKVHSDEHGQRHGLDQPPVEVHEDRSLVWKGQGMGEGEVSEGEAQGEGWVSEDRCLVWKGRRKRGGGAGQGSGRWGRGCGRGVEGAWRGHGRGTEEKRVEVPIWIMDRTFPGGPTAHLEDQRGNAEGEKIGMSGCEELQGERRHFQAGQRRT